MQIVTPLFLWLLLLGPGSTQDGKPKIPSSLDEQIAQALQTNPEVLMAEAKLREAEAAYRETRLRITQDVMQAHNQLEAQEMLLQQSRMKLADGIRLKDKGMISESELMQDETRVIQSENELAQSRARLQYLLGIDPGAPGSSSVRAQNNHSEAPRRASRPAPSKTAEALLSRPVLASFENAPFTEVLPMINDVLSSESPTGSIVVNQYALDAWGVPLEEILVSWETQEPTTLGNFLSAIADVHGLCFVIRDYGILVTLEDQAQMLYAPVIPPEVEMHPSVVPVKRR